MGAANSAAVSRLAGRRGLCPLIRLHKPRGGLTPVCLFNPQIPLPAQNVSSHRTFQVCGRTPGPVCAGKITREKYNSYAGLNVRPLVCLIIVWLSFDLMVY